MQIMVHILFFCPQTNFSTFVFPKGNGNKQSRREKRTVEEEEDVEDIEEDSRRKRALNLSERKTTSITGPIQPSCQVEYRTADLKDAKPYHRRYKVCKNHSKAPLILVAGSESGNASVSNAAGFMIYQSSMKLKGVVAGAWQATMNIEAKALTTLMEMGELNSQRKLNLIRLVELLQET